MSTNTRSSNPQAVSLNLPLAADNDFVSDDSSEENEQQSDRTHTALNRPLLDKRRPSQENESRDEYKNRPTIAIHASVTPLHIEPTTKREGVTYWVYDQRLTPRGNQQSGDGSPVCPITACHTTDTKLLSEEASGQAAETDKVYGRNAPISTQTEQNTATMRVAKDVGTTKIYLKKYTNGTPVQWISGLVAIPDQKLVAVAETSVTIVPINGSDEQTRIFLPQPLHDIAQVSSSVIAVTSHSNKRIHFINSRKSEYDHALRVNGECRGIARFKNDLVVTYDNPVKVEIITKSGTVKNTVISEREGSRLFTWPWYVAVSPDQTIIYISDASRDTVTSLNLSGEVLATYHNRSRLRGPRGLTVDRVGSVYVCGFNSNNLVQLTADLARSPYWRTYHGKYPWSVCYCHATDRIFIGMRSNRVRVNQLK